MLKKVKIDISTYILLLLALFSGYMKQAFLLLFIVFIHEIGHIFFFFLFHISVESVIIYPFGGVSKINKLLHERIYKDVLCALGGILFQSLLFLLFSFLYTKNLIVNSTYDLFVKLNFSIILFNLLPLIPLDGSKIVFSFFTKFFSYRRSFHFLLCVSFVTLFFFFLFNFIYCIQDIVIYLFLLWNLYLYIIEYPYIMNKFYVERVLYDHYFDGICYKEDIQHLRLTKFYYIKKNGTSINEKKYIKEWMRNRCK